MRIAIQGKFTLFKYASISELNSNFGLLIPKKIKLHACGIFIRVPRKDTHHYPARRFSFRRVLVGVFRGKQQQQLGRHEEFGICQQSKWCPRMGATCDGRESDMGDQYERKFPHEMGRGCGNVLRSNRQMRLLLFCNISAQFQRKSK